MGSYSWPNLLFTLKVWPVSAGKIGRLLLDPTSLPVHVLDSSFGLLNGYLETGEHILEGNWTNLDLPNKEGIFAPALLRSIREWVNHITAPAVTI